MKNMIIKASMAAALVGLLGGCATTEQIAQIQATADRALETASNASDRANNALSTANSALDAARRAQSTADAARACCNENSTKIDRAFEQSMRK